ncbi:fructose-2,6-bisphosphatase [Lysinibacillus contaminans]|uniref:Fructose-2,6-bisphosphatase n=1 Tax=Lysinibacillus contaminans TaxID=1293441 RepID=A0ABR5K366_9BACI|nr:histidine phosphatase family protein [Lysinibacillus contaminans]KOS69162.1 fructose-2,6-bisphosphatase [Lysinibacillus contaminans]
MKQIIYLLRHGETEFNVKGKYQGELDSPLTPEGIEQVENNGRLLKLFIDNPKEWDFISSPLGRAKRSTDIICEVIGYDKNKVTMDNRLREVSVGKWAGLTTKEIEKSWPDLIENTNSYNWYFNSPNGESYDSVVERVSDWLRSIRDKEKVIVMSHGLTGRIIRGVYKNLEKDQALILEVSQNTFFKLADKQIARFCSEYEEF